MQLGHCVDPSVCTFWCDIWNPGPGLPALRRTMGLFHSPHAFSSGTTEINNTQRSGSDAQCYGLLFTLLSDTSSDLSQATNLQSNHPKVMKIPLCIFTFSPPLFTCLDLMQTRQKWPVHAGSVNLAGVTNLTGSGSRPVTSYSAFSEHGSAWCVYFCMP